MRMLINVEPPSDAWSAAFPFFGNYMLKFVDNVVVRRNTHVKGILDGYRLVKIGLANVVYLACSVRIFRIWEQVSHRTSATSMKVSCVAS